MLVFPGFPFRSSRFLSCLSAAAFVLVPLALSADASTVTFIESGTSSFDGYPLTVRAVLTGTDQTLTIDLYNEGPASRKKTDILTSFYFNITNPANNLRPGLTYVSGTGQAFAVDSSAILQNQPVSWTPQSLTGSSTAPSNLIAVNDNDQGWQFKTFDPPATIPPTLGFGIGTVGNSLLQPPLFPNDVTFNGPVVSGTSPNSMINLGIYSDGGSSGLLPANGFADNSFLIRNHARFTFTVTGTQVSDLNPFDASWVGGNVTFGFGTLPETLFLPEPASCTLTATAVVAGVGWLVRRRSARLR
jgi:hypothetical protein